MCLFAGFGAFGAVMAIGAGQVANGLTVTVPQIPTVTSPTVTVPTVTVPTTPTVTTPTVTVPKTPTVTVPKTPTVTVPKAPSLPKAPTATAPRSAPTTTSLSSKRLPSTSLSAPRVTSGAIPSPIGTRQSAPDLGVVPSASGGPAAAGAPASLGSGSPAFAAGELAAIAQGGAVGTESLRAVVAQLQGCFYAISGMERRVLLLRSGLSGGPPSSRRAAARVLGISAAKVARLERRGLRTLAGAAAHGGCVAGKGLAAVPAPLAILWSAVSSPASAPGPSAGVGQVSGGALAAVAPDWSSLRPASLPWGTLALAVVAIGILTGIALIFGGTTLRRRRPFPAPPLTLVQPPRESQLFARRDDEIAVNGATRSGRRVAAGGRGRSEG